MILIDQEKYKLYSYEKESEIEDDIIQVSQNLFGKNRIYLDVKKKIGAKGKTRNIPDGYLIDLTSKKDPTLYVVENELAKHDPLKHIAVQILEFSLSFETSPFKVKSILKDEIFKNSQAQQQLELYCKNNHFDNIDVLLEKMIYGNDSFNALVIIDEIPDELETVLLSKFKFPVEILTLQRYISSNNSKAYSFEPFLSDVILEESKNTLEALDPSEIDTIVIPAREDGFNEVFANENRWYSIRIHSKMIPKIKYIAAYQVAPISAITHVAKVDSIEQWQDTNKYVVNFIEKAEKIDNIKMVKNGSVKAPQSSRYTSIERLRSAKNLDEVF